MKDKEREREGGTERERVKKKKLLVYFSSWNCIPMCSNMVQNLLPTLYPHFSNKISIIGWDCESFFLCSLSTTERVRAWTYLNTDVNSCHTLMIHHKYVLIYKRKKLSVVFNYTELTEEFVHIDWDETNHWIRQIEQYHSHPVRLTSPVDRKHGSPKSPRMRDSV